jgi:prepilin-type N-terminal cleavage/methylation domain-containing protein
MTPSVSMRRGFTLVELLVVASIMLLMFGLVVSGARPSSRGQIRQVAQSLASLLTSAQSQALGNPAGAGLVLQSGTASGFPATMSVTITAAAIPPLLTGTTGNPSGLPPINPRQTFTTVTLFPLNGDADELQHGYKIRFGGAAATGTAFPFQPPSAWMALAATSAGGGLACTGTVAFRTDAGQTVVNSVWPEPMTSPGGGKNPLDFQVARYPTVGETIIEMAKSVAIDLRYSGIGEDMSTGWGTLAGKGSLAIVFDSVGGVDALMQRIEGPASFRSQPPIDPVEPIYFLVSARSEIDDASFNPLSSQQAIWVVIHPQTGRVTTAPNVAQSGIVDAVALRAARAKARAAVMSWK